MITDNAPTLLYDKLVIVFCLIPSFKLVKDPPDPKHFFRNQNLL
jgi:hypothetical protein